MRVVPYIKLTNIQCFFLFNSKVRSACKVVGRFAGFDQIFSTMKTPLFLLMLFFATVSRGQVYVGPMVGGQLSWTKFDNEDYYDSYGIKPRVRNPGLISAGPSGAKPEWGHSCPQFMSHPTNHP